MIAQACINYTIWLKLLNKFKLKALHILGRS
ncbi:MAG: hypothetical protein JWQ84_2737 [Mucilaginibacter sp.]|nr:hypothetical protein [Mucilaginibacter sp.]MDB5140307.1 hypothetical protein [Mucilaginibacter sp.]